MPTDPIESAPTLTLEEVRAAGPPVEATGSATLWDAGDGVALFELHTQVADIDEVAVGLLERAPDHLAAGFRALAIGSEHRFGFSLGASLTPFVQSLETGDAARFSGYLRRGQAALLALRHGRHPVVAAVRRMTLGGGCELMLHAHAVVAHVNARVGLPERGLGILPGWGGVTQMLRRAQAKAAPEAAAQAVFDTISAATVAQGAAAAVEAGFLDPDTEVVADHAALLGAAKAAAVRLAPGFAPVAPAAIVALGPEAAAGFEPGIAARLEPGAFTDLDAVACRAIVTVVCGGGATRGSSLAEAEVMALEHDAFVSLAAEPRVLERMRHMQATGQPLVT